MYWALQRRKGQNRIQKFVINHFFLFILVLRFTSARLAGLDRGEISRSGWSVCGVAGLFEYRESMENARMYFICTRWSGVTGGVGGFRPGTRCSPTKAGCKQLPSRCITRTFAHGSPKKPEV